ncbi:hypothetical protein Rhe02_54650 [Rhizocola hellebori]|uniref:Uncharacterized protein n=1 Tax=Rhizocola hellebori TaxID=1392758 RepID=A0A8J3QAT7_9ACTN|nr:hypothetical protein [Rhizocola hellebori]GIH07398.1 hypothetical protein Rhe02_54650 [Rhizocola hellebori]
MTNPPPLPSVLTSAQLTAAVEALGLDPSIVLRLSADSRRVRVDIRLPEHGNEVFSAEIPVIHEEANGG